MEGIQAMCEDLGVQPDDIVVLVLRWVLLGRRGAGRHRDVCCCCCESAVAQVGSCKPPLYAVLPLVTCPPHCLLPAPAAGTLARRPCASTAARSLRRAWLRWPATR